MKKLLGHFKYESFMKGNDAKEPSSAEEVDLGYIDLAESDPVHYRQSHENKRLSPPPVDSRGGN